MICGQADHATGGRTIIPIFDSKQGIRGGNLLKLPSFRGFDFADVKM
jgi:hypothetical protein